MHDLAVSSAAFLTDAPGTWTPGRRLLFEPMAGDCQTTAPTSAVLPRAGRVVRIEAADEDIWRIAVRIETDLPALDRSTPKVCDETAARPSVLPGQSFSPFEMSRHKNRARREP
jgi:hypothetical protein